jgi:predicted nucleic acid-binding protein
MLHLDTSVLIGALTGQKSVAAALRARFDEGEPVFISAPVLYEWLRGHRKPEELQTQEDLLPSSLAVPFGPEQAALAARLYLHVKRPRGRETDLAIAACAIASEARLWSLNPEDFKDIPGLNLTR